MCALPFEEDGAWHREASGDGYAYGSGDPDSIVVGETVLLSVVTSVPVDVLICTSGTGYSCGYEINCSEVSAMETMCTGGEVCESEDGTETIFALAECSYGEATELHVDYCTVMPVVTTGSVALGA